MTPPTAWRGQPGKGLCALAGLALGALAGCGTGTVRDGIAPASSVTGGFYSEQQATRGAATFREACSECHSVNADFRGATFEWDWRRRTAWDLFRRMRETMPEDFPGLLSDREYADIIAFILRANDYIAGSTELAPTEEALVAVPLGTGAPKSGPRGGREP